MIAIVQYQKDFVFEIKISFEIANKQNLDK